MRKSNVFRFRTSLLSVPWRRRETKNIKYVAVYRFFGETSKAEGQLKLYTLAYTNTNTNPNPNVHKN